MFIVTQDKELINSEHVVKFKVVKGFNSRPSYLQAIMENDNPDVDVYIGSQENVDTAMDNLIEAFMSNATVIDYSNNKGSAI